MFEIAWYGFYARQTKYCKTFDEARREAQLKSIDYTEAFIWNPDKRLIEVWRFGEKLEGVV